MDAGRTSILLLATSLGVAASFSCTLSVEGIPGAEQATAGAGGGGAGENVGAGGASVASGGGEGGSPGVTSSSGGDPCAMLSCKPGASCANGQCICDSGLDDCPGACVDFDSDANNCGACDNVCESSLCGSARCLCVPDETDCGARIGCTDLDWDADNCGTCGVACQWDQYCWDGSCQDFG